MYYSPYLSIVRLTLTFFWTLTCCSIQALFFFFPKNFFYFIPKLFFKVLLIIFGIKVKLQGKMEDKNMLYISNHSSYLDIIILGSKLDALFVAKSEISKWPIINKVVKLGKTIFVDRKKIFNTKFQVSLLEKKLTAGTNIILFPEGTSSDGSKVLPFKSSLFAVTEKKLNNHYIQPISISYTGLDGLPMCRKFLPFFAWYGDMDLAPHAWKFLGLSSCEIDLSFHEKIPFSKFKSRKDFSKYCFNIIADQVTKDLNKKNRENKFNLYNAEYL